MKVLLVNPPIPDFWYNDEFYLPSSMLYLASSLREKGHTPKILDMKIFKKDNKSDHKRFLENVLFNTINEFKPDFIGFGCLFSGNFPDVLLFANICKQRFPNVPIVAGGIHFTIHAEKILKNCDCFDYIVLGEGEISFAKLIEIVSNKGDLSSLDGIGWRANGYIKINPKKYFIENVDDIPFPAYDLVNIEDYYVDTSNWHNPKNLPINTSIPIITSRSCPHKCSFCSMFTVMGPKWRPRTPENVVKEIEFLYHSYNHRHFSIMDDNFTLNKKRTLEICDLIIRKGLNIQFETPNGLNINSLDSEVIDALVNAGMIRTALAIESGSDYIRNQVMRKNLSRNKIMDVIKITKQYPNLYVSAFFVIGMPEETIESLEDTYNMIKQIEVNKVQLMNIVPFPCTPVFNQALKDNLFIELDIENLYASSELYFKNTNRFFIKPYQLEIQDLIDFREKCKPLLSEKKQYKFFMPK